MQSRSTGRFRMGVLVSGSLLTLVVSLSVHTVMLQVLRIPYPANLPRFGLERLPDQALFAGGAAYLVTLLSTETVQRSRSSLFVALFLLCGMMNEELLRRPLMDMVVEAGHTAYPFVDAIPRYLVLAAVVGAIAFLRPVLTSPTRIFAAAVGVAAPVYLVLRPFVEKRFAPVQAWTSAREGDALYQPPYDWHVEVPAYVTFAEPVVAAFLIAHVVSRTHGRSRPKTFAVITLLIFALRGSFFNMFVNVRYAGTDAFSAMASYGQFTLESLALAVLTAGTWVLADRGLDHSPRPME